MSQNEGTLHLWYCGSFRLKTTALIQDILRVRNFGQQNNTINPMMTGSQTQTSLYSTITILGGRERWPRTWTIACLFDLPGRDDVMFFCSDPCKKDRWHMAMTPFSCGFRHMQMSVHQFWEAEGRWAWWRLDHKVTHPAMQMKPPKSTVLRKQETVQVVETAKVDPTPVVAKVKKEKMLGSWNDGKVFFSLFFF